MRSRKVLSWGAAALALALGLVGGARSARADGYALNRFDPAPAGDRMFGAPSPFTAGDLTLHAMLLGDYAYHPLVLHREEGDEDVGAIVGNQLFFHLNASLALFRRVTINVEAPIALVQSGDSPAAEGLSFSSPSSAQFGDLRAGVRLTLVGEYHDPIQLALGGYVWLPTGASDSFVSDNQVRGMPQLIAGGRADRVVWSLAVGPEFRKSQKIADLRQGAMVKFGGGIGFLLDDARRFQLGPEFSGAVTVEDANQRNTNAEVLLDARYRVLGDLEIGAGIGPGLTSGAGTPTLRAVAMIAYTPEQKVAPTDRDRDGIADTADACPDTPGVASADPAKNGCPPPPDRDKDGIIDAQDACPEVPGVASTDPAKNGCPPDTDGDGILDAKDACPTEAGPASDDPTKNGCPPPPDRDKDGIVDAQDACPDIPGVASADPQQNGCPPDTDGDGIRDDKDACRVEKGVPDPDPTKNGCPKAVRVTETEIFILQQVQFDTAKTTIKKVSDDLLNEVAGVLKDHPEIVKIEVQGHTDNRGGKQFNDTLSQGRADAVKKALVARGIDAGRLSAKGYGQNVPIADNGTDEGRQQNRRVQFKILEKKKAQQ